MSLLGLWDLWGIRCGGEIWSLWGLWLLAELIPLGLALLNLSGWPKVASTARPGAARVSVLIPARNEEANLPACLETALSQGEIVVEVLVYDDHSTDRTPIVIADYARERRVAAVARLPLAEGWCGKNFACAQLARAATGDWLLFLDADARLSAGAVSRMIAEAHRRRLTFLSCWPALEMESFWERTLMPLLNFAVFTLFPAPFSLRFFRPSLALAHGACLLIERESYGRLGGHAAVRDQIFEDVRLAQLWRKRGERGVCLDGQDLVRVRMYASLGEIWLGFQKNFFPAFRHQFNFWAFITLHFTLFLLPFLLLPLILLITALPGSLLTQSPITCFGRDLIIESLITQMRIYLSPITIVEILIGMVLMMRLLLALYFRHPWWSALLHPLGETVLIMIGLTSWWQCRSGRGVEWRGRRYRQRGRD